MIINDEEREKYAQIIVDQFNGIQPQYKEFYRLSIHYSTTRCLESFLHYEEMKNENCEPDYLIGILQEAIGHAAALSRYFWPSTSGGKRQSNLAKL